MRSPEGSSPKVAAVRCGSSAFSRLLRLCAVSALLLAGVSMLLLGSSAAVDSSKALEAISAKEADPQPAVAAAAAAADSGEAVEDSSADEADSAKEVASTDSSKAVEDSSADEADSAKEVASTDSSKAVEDSPADEADSAKEVAAAGAFPKLAGHSRMFASDPNVMELVTASDYETALKGPNASGRAMILMLYSAWCPHCLSFKSTFSDLAEALKDAFDFAALNCAESGDLLDICSKLNVTLIPSIKLFVSKKTHMQLPAADRVPKEKDSSSPFWMQVADLKDGGRLNHFNEAEKDALAIHTLALPAGDVYEAVAYAARMTLQNIPRSKL